MHEVDLIPFAMTATPLGLTAYGKTKTEARYRLAEMVRLLWDTVEKHRGNPAEDFVARMERGGYIETRDDRTALEEPIK